MKWVRRSLRFFLVTGGIIVLTSLGIDASQYLAGSQSALGILADRATETSCPAGMVQVSRAGDDYCIDEFEVSVGESCPITSPSHFAETAKNLESSSCVPESKADAMPWTQVTYHQAKELCAKAGKHLPTNAEWYEAALGTIATGCLVSESAVSAGVQATECVSGIGARHMVGNVWEWVDAVAYDGALGEQELPLAGYVQNADQDGVAVQTGEESNAAFGDDYFWNEPTGAKAFVRGGFYNSGADGGLYSIHAGIDPSFAGAAIGFRCAL